MHSPFLASIFRLPTESAQEEKIGTNRGDTNTGGEQDGMKSLEISTKIPDAA
jgi:hypothetical protein